MLGLEFDFDLEDWFFACALAGIRFELETFSQISYGGQVRSNSIRTWKHFGIVLGPEFDYDLEHWIFACALGPEYD